MVGILLERIPGGKVRTLTITGADFEPIEEYLYRQRGVISEINDCHTPFESVSQDKVVSVNGKLIRIFDSTRPLLLEFLTATKAELERQMRVMPLVVRIGSDEEEKEETSDES